MTPAFWSVVAESVAPGRYDWVVLDRAGNILAEAIGMCRTHGEATRAAEAEVMRRYEAKHRAGRN